MRRARGTKKRLGPNYYYLAMERDRDPETHKRRRIERYFRGTSAAADDELDRMAVEAHRPMPPRDVTVKDYLEKKYLPWAKGKVALTTYNGYHSYIKTHIVPRHGSLMLSKVTAYDLDMLVQSMRADLGEGHDQTINHAYVVYRTALRQAVVWKRITDDPTAGTKAPHVEDRDLVTLDQAQANRYLDLFIPDPDLGPAVVLAIGNGLRRAEVCGLDWQRDVVLVKATATAPASGIVTISENKLQSGKMVWTKAPKTKKSRRALLLAAWQVEALLPHRGIGYVAKLDPGALSAAYRAKIAAYNEANPKTPLPESPFRDLRNAHGSIILDLGGDLKALADNYGHQDSQVTEHKYTRPHLVYQERFAATVQQMRTPNILPTSERDAEVSTGTE
jgi:integrase